MTSPRRLSSEKRKNKRDQKNGPPSLTFFGPPRSEEKVEGKISVRTMEDASGKGKFESQRG